MSNSYKNKWSNPKTPNKLNLIKNMCPNSSSNIHKMWSKCSQKLKSHSQVMKIKWKWKRRRTMSASKAKMTEEVTVDWAGYLGHWAQTPEDRNIIRRNKNNTSFPEAKSILIKVPSKEIKNIGSRHLKDKTSKNKDRNLHYNNHRNWLHFQNSPKVKNNCKSQKWVQSTKNCKTTPMAYFFKKQIQKAQLNQR